MKYYSLKNILKYKAKYNVIFGERSNGKTFAILEHILRRYIDTGEQGALIRRLREDYIGKTSAKTSFDGINNSGLVEKLTGGEYDRIVYDSMAFYLARMEKDAIVKAPEPLVWCFALTQAEHYKSAAFPRITTVFFDEMLTRRSYLADEFSLFTSVLSTIIRNRDDVTIFMAGNTVTKYCPYFAEMGLKKAKTMEEGTIDLYRYGESGLTVAVERTSHDKAGKASDVYFAFKDSPKLAMITRGGWEMELYPHCPMRYRPKDVKFTYFIVFDEEVLQCEVVKRDGSSFTFIHRKTTPIKDEKRDLVYQQEYSHRPNVRRRLTRDSSEIGRKLIAFFHDDKVFYQDNEVGEIVRNYLMWCEKAS